jgi:hypothetical protein
MAAVRLSRLQTRILRWLAADEQRTRGMITSSHPELVAALPSAKGNISHSLRRLETQGLMCAGHVPVLGGCKSLCQPDGGEGERSARASP